MNRFRQAVIGLENITKRNALAKTIAPKTFYMKIEGLEKG